MRMRRAPPCVGQGAAVSSTAFWQTDLELKNENKYDAVFLTSPDIFSLPERLRLLSSGLLNAAGAVVWWCSRGEGGGILRVAAG